MITYYQPGAARTRASGTFAGSEIATGIPTGTITDMATNVTISLDETTVGQIRQAAANAGVSLSAWLGRAARQQLLRDSLDAHDRWRREHPLDAARADAEAQLDELDREAARITDNLGHIGQTA